MDREALKRWLQRPRHTWRWRPGPAEATDDRYCALEATDVQLRWSRWSHDPEDGGEQAVEWQSLEDFRANGPRWDAPQDVLRELRNWIATHAPAAEPERR